MVAGAVRVLGQARDPQRQTGQRAGGGNERRAMKVDYIVWRRGFLWACLACNTLPIHLFLLP
jgi:hypothetical protein